MEAGFPGLGTPIYYVFFPVNYIKTREIEPKVAALAGFEPQTAEVRGSRVTDLLSFKQEMYDKGG